MKVINRSIIIWAPRIVGLGLAVFLGLFALDSLRGSGGVIAGTVAIVMGLVPAFIVLGAVGLGWKHEAIAAAIFAGLAVFYTASALDHPAWIAVIAGPLALEAALFLMSWWFKSNRRGMTSHS